MGGTRLFSVKEIKDMCIKKDIPEDFRKYLEGAPQNVEKILMRWFNGNLESLTQMQHEENVELYLSDGAEGIQEKTNPYKALSFEERLEVNGLYIHVTQDGKCPIHGSTLERIQVVIKYDHRNRFCIITQCCKECKCIYCSLSEIEEIKKSITDKNIPCEVFEK